MMPLLLIVQTIQATGDLTTLASGLVMLAQGAVHLVATAQIAPTGGGSGVLANTLALLIVGLGLLLLATRHLDTAIRLVAAQSIGLAIMTVLVALTTNYWHLWLTAGLVLLIKGLIVPRILFYVLDRIKIRHEDEIVIQTKLLLVVASGLIVLAYWVTQPLGLPGSATTANGLSNAVAMILLGCLIMVTRKKALTQIIGLIVMENGLYLASIAVTVGMPLVVELGIFFDLLIGALVMGILAFRINQTFDTINVDYLRRLKH